jgi:Trypsin
MRSARVFRRVFLLAIATLLAVALTAPAIAITNGELDGNDHPFVGSLVIDIPGQGLSQFCSGTLIDHQVFLTASHCTAPLAGIPAAAVKVTFASTIDQNAELFTGTPVTNPNYNGFQGQGGASDPGDIAVFLLDDDPGIDPAQLPTAGLLDQLKASGVLKDTRFTAVGYGTVREDNHAGWQGILDNVDRRRAEQGFHSLTKAWLHLPMTPSNGNGGTCYGDSGGPHFIHLDGVETEIVVSLTVTGDAQCKASDRTYRTDTAAARAFLDGYVTLP